MSLTATDEHIETIRRDFPILSQKINGQPLVYFDNAATSQTPTQVVEVIRDYYARYNSNIHRGVHHLSQQATAEHEAARQTIATHLNANREEEVIFTCGCTDAINLVSQILKRANQLTNVDKIIVSELDHHSNIVPWQMLAEETGATLHPIRVTDQGELDLHHFHQLLDERVKVVAVNHISNSLGTINPVKEITSAAKNVGAMVLIDGAQALPHLKVDVQDLGCDFYVFSGHKVYGPTGVGVLWGKFAVLDALPPWRGGGEMIKQVSFDGTTYNELPFKYEAGTPDIIGGIALAKAIDYLNQLDLEWVQQHEHHLTQVAHQGLLAIDGLKIYGESKHKAGVVSFLVDGIHHFDLGTLLDQMGIAVRTGHHCCQPLMARYGITGTLRASFAAYNTIEEVEKLIAAVDKGVKMLR